MPITDLQGKQLAIPRGQIDFGKRARGAYKAVDELADSIKEVGLISPIAVVEKDKCTESQLILASDDDKPYLLLAGGRRFMAMEKINLTPIPCRVYDHFLNDYEIKTIELAENLFREDLTYAEEVALKLEIHEFMVSVHGKRTSTSPGAPGHSQADTAKMLNQNAGGLSVDLRLAEAIRIMPELGEMKNKSEAIKTLKVANKRDTTSKRAAKVRERADNTPKEKIKKEMLASYQVGDFFEKAKGFPDETFHLIEVDPPYAIDLRNIKSSNIINTIDYNEVDAGDYPEFIKKTVDECYRLLRPDGWILFWYAIHPWYNLVLNSLLTAGKPDDVSVEDWLSDGRRLFGRGLPAYWGKPITAQTKRPDFYLANQVENFLYFRKPAARLGKPGAGNLFNEYPDPPTEKRHSTQRPISLMKKIISTFIEPRPSANILVPFAGSGNTIIASYELGMKAVGFDLAQIYKDRYDVFISQGEIGKYSKEIKV